MSLPDCSHMMRVGQLRYIQSVYETAEYQNADNLQHKFLTPLQRMICLGRGALQLSRLRSDPFYTYLIARTRYYDELFLKAISDNAAVIINIGCGSDTRAYRFSHLLKPKGIRVLECDQPEAIVSKQGVARQNWPVDHVSYLSINLNGLSWNELESWLERNAPERVFVLMEGVSPYIGREAFGRFLDFLSDRLPAGSPLAYDFKIQGIADRFGLAPGGGELFRLAEDRAVATIYHQAHGFRLDRMESSSKLMGRLLPRLDERHARVFSEDALLQLTLE